MVKGDATGDDSACVAGEGGGWAGIGSVTWSGVAPSVVVLGFAFAC